MTGTQLKALALEMSPLFNGPESVTILGYFPLLDIKGLVPSWNLPIPAWVFPLI